MMTDIEIAQSTEMLPIRTVAEKAGIDEELLEYYGKVKAKIDITPLRAKPRKGKLILVTAINPTPAGEGKTTTSSVWPTLWPSWARTPCSACGSPPSAPCSA